MGKVRKKKRKIKTKQKKTIENIFKKTIIKKNNN